MSPESETAAEPRFIKAITGNIQATTERSFSTKLHDGTARAVTIRPGTYGKVVRKDPNVDAFTFAKPLSKIHKNTERIAETTPVNMEIKETTSSMEVFNRGSTQKADSPPSTETPRTTMSPKSETDAEPRFITGNIQATTEKSFSGLRMRQDIPADTTKLHDGTARAVTNRPGTDRKEVEQDPKVDSFTFPKPSPAIYKPATDTLRKTADDNVPLCRGLIHRTEAGWKRCTERSAGMGTKRFSSDAFKDTGEQWERERMFIRDQKDNLISDDEYYHFYYFDGVLKRVQNNYYPRQRRRKRSPNNSENSVFTVRNKRDNLLSYIQRLTLRNKSPQIIRYRR
ncbi:uncharacterized protein LOC119477723 [Sebastes umbrosus]|uniref:uncharacterized protein LOC119477723 n=1 Tax=Sebastes umbrosus TaxID=72105 RepID=UPI00189D4CFD|nr:uncharacterized protein LOC119477723 [Sebastes umbrosus]